VIERKIIGGILEAGRNAPSPGKRQTLEFVVIEDEDRLSNLSNVLGDDRVKDAPTSVVILSDPERMSRLVKDPLEACYAEVSGAAQNMRVMASSEGLCSNLVTGFDSDAVAGVINAPQRKRPLAVVSFAYCDSPVKSSDRFGMNQMCFYDEYGSQIDSVFDSWEWEGYREEKSKYIRMWRRFIRKLEELLPKRL